MCNIILRSNTCTDRITLYIPFRPGEKDDWWRELAAQGMRCA